MTTSKHSENVYSITGDYCDEYSKLFMDLIVLGNYGHVHESITPVNFPGECISGFDGILVHFKRGIGSDEVVREMDQMDLRPATMLELLAFGVKFPGIQQDLPIVELASSWEDQDGNRRVGCLDDWIDGREVDLQNWTRVWSVNYLFLAVPKSKHVAA